MPIQKLPGSAIAPGTITVVQLESTVATTVQTGGGPKLTNIQITDNAYTVLDDTAVDVTGGYIKITGTGFVTGCSVIVGQLPAASVTFISSTEVRAQLSAQPAGTYIVYLVNPDGGVGIRVNGVTHSASPAWQTASGLPEQYDGVAINLSLVATEATSYTITSGSLPPGLSLNSNTGVISGTVSGVANDTLYTFTVRATDAQLQDSPRTFTVTITVSDPYFKLTTLLLSGSAVSANTVVRDSSTNNFNLTVFGDARASNFTPYGTGWSVYFDGSGDYLTIPASANLSLGTNNFTMEFWMNATVYSRDPYDRRIIRCIADPMAGTGNGFEFSLNGNPSGGIGQLQFGASSVFVSTPGSVCDGTWKHIAVTRETNTFKLFLNGNIVATTTGTPTITDGATYPIWIAWFGGTGQGHYNGYLSNFRIVRNEVLYTANFTPATSSLTSTSNTAVLTCHTSRFADSSANNLAITKTGDTKVVSFNPFNITNTGVNGSMYFDGTGDYCAVAANSAFSFPADFTWEAWAYPFGMPNGGYAIIYATGGSGSQDQFGLSTTEIFAAGTAITAPIRINSWMHCVICRQGSTVRYFVNGILVGTLTNSATIGSNANNALIGIRSDGLHAFQGYIADLRIIKGTALYTANFTPPTQPLTAVANTQLLTLQYDQPSNNHTFLDSSSNQFLITRNGNATQGTFSPFSPAGWSVYFIDTSSHNISAVTGAETSPGTGDFCAELWYWTSKSGNQALIGNLESNTETQWVFTLITGGVIRIQGWNNTYVSGTSGPLNSWNHVAVCRSGTTMSIFVNGSRVGTATVTNNFSGTSNIRVGGPNGVDYFLGYISNARFVKGSSVYDPTQVSITVPTGPLTAITNTKFLVCQGNRLRDISSNNFTLTTSGSPQIQAFSPFAPTAVYSPVAHGGSVYLDGTGDYLNTGSDVGFNLGVGNFTWEFWTYLTASPADGNILFQPRTPAGIDAVLFGYKSGSNFTIYATTNGGSSWNLFSNTVIIAVADVLNRWAHWAFIRNGSTYTVYVDGISKVSGTSASQISQATNVFTLGAVVSGYFSGFRFVKAQALSTGNFTPPTAPLAANTIGWTGANVATSLTGTVNFLLNFTDAAILDSTGRQVFETVADAKSSGVVTKFTGGSISFDGTGDALRFIQSPYWNITSTTTHTIEAWVYHTGTTAKTICSNYWYQDGSSEYGWLFQILNTSSVLRFVSAAASSIVSSTTAVPTGAWVHVAATIVNLNVTFYINGVNAGGGGTVSSINYTNTIPSVGAAYSNGGFSSGPFVGYINDLRITQGHARYTANFTAPTGPARLK